jgi:hypothetical protein
MAKDKDTIYIDVDDEITGIIDKLKASDGKVVALVLPKRAGVFQSIVNMKLLKRAADSSKKNAVLITSEAGLIPLAGAAGVHVAKTLTSKPEIPVAPALADESIETVKESEADANDPVINPDQSVGELAGAKPPVDNGVETIALDDDELAPEDAPKPTGKTFEPPKPKKDKKLAIPNFERFRLLLILFVVIIIILIGLFIFLNASLKKATIDIKTDATNVNTSQNFTLTTDSKTSSLLAKIEQQQKTYTEQVTTTGQKNDGTQASGSITVSAGSCGPSVPSDVPSGTGVSSNGLTYITQADITFQPQVSHGQCTYEGEDSANNQSNIPITAQSGGANYNTSGTPFTIADDSSYTATGSASGGTDNIVQTVNQNDINNAKAKVNTNDSSVKQALENQLKGDNYYPINATYNSGTPVATSSAPVGAAANSVTVTEVVTYTMFGVQQSSLTSSLDNSIDAQINTNKQSILDNGLTEGSISVNSQTAASASITLATTAVVGPELNNSAIKSAAAGQKAGTIQSQLTSNPDVTGVTVHFSPFWVSSAPKNTQHITINIAKPSSTQKSS